MGLGVGVGVRVAVALGEATWIGVAVLSGAVGAGVGLTTTVTSTVRGGVVIGVDPSAEMARQARRRNRALVRRGRVRLVLGRSGALPCAAGQFARVCTINTIYFWPMPPTDLAELHRVLQPGGRAVVTFRAQADPAGALRVRTTFGAAYSVDEVVAMLAAAGFRDVRTEVRRLRFMTAVCLVARA